MLIKIASWNITEIRKEHKQIEKQVGKLGDQGIFGKYAYLNPDEVGIDHGCNIFWTMTKERLNLDSYMQIENHSVNNSETQTSPSLIHVPYLRKYYPAFLVIALRLGIKLNRKNVDLALYHAHVIHNVPNIDEHLIFVPDELKTVLSKSLTYRYLVSHLFLTKSYYTTRKKAGKIRRKLIGF